MKRFFVIATAMYLSFGISTAWAANGGNYRKILTAASAQTCTTIEINNSGSGSLNSVVSAGVQTASISFFDEGAAPTCASADLVYSITLTAGQSIVLNVPLLAGLAYTLTAAAVPNIVVTYN